MNTSEYELVDALTNEELTYIKFQMIDGKQILLSKDTIISVTYRN